MAAEPISSERLAKVDAARQQWIRKLVDLSRRNNLLYFRELKVGTLDISAAPADAMRELLQSGASASDGVRLKTLVSEDRRKQAEAALAEIADRARSNFEEKGLNTLFLEFGLASLTRPTADATRRRLSCSFPLKRRRTGGDAIRRGPSQQNGAVVGQALNTAAVEGFGQRRRDSSSWRLEA